MDNKYIFFFFSENIAHLILPLAHEYQCKDTLSKVDMNLADHCEKNNPQSVQLIGDILEVELYNLPIVLEVAIEKASRKTFKGFVDHVEFQKISANTKERIYLMRWENLDNFISEKILRAYFNIDPKIKDIREKIAKHMQ